jgi:GTPase SAR1 family protein
MDFHVACPTMKIFKLPVVGDNEAGKTSLIRQYVESFFTELSKTTIGVQFASM